MNAESLLPRAESAEALQEKRTRLRKKFWKVVCWAMFAAQVVMLAEILLLNWSNGIGNNGIETAVIIALDILGVALSILILQGSMQSKLLDSIVETFTLLVFFGSVYMGWDALSWMLEGMPSWRWIKWVVDTGSYLCPIVMSWLFYRFLCAWLKLRRNKIRLFDVLFHIVVVAAAVVVLGNLFGGYFFTLTEEGFYQRSDTYMLSLLLPSLLLVMCARLIMLGKGKPSEKAVLMIYPLVPYIAILLNAYEVTPSVLCVFVFISVCFLYTNIFVRREKELADKQAALAQSELDSMLLQINPHFIYNTLGSVASLCSDDPERAKTMLYSFSGYLRNNFGEMTRRAMIPFEKEMAHLELYIEIEKMRFPDINVVTDYQVTDFELPSLSVQPLVENAITHGVMGREAGGTVIISTYEDEQNYCISVVDDGVGFDNETPQDGRRHIGIKNVRRRLQMLCGGTLRFHSVVGKGTAAIICIPKGTEGGRER